MVRITNSMMIDNFVINMQKALNKQNKYSNQVSTGRKLVSIGEDPIGVIKTLTAREQIAQYEQFAGNVTSAKAWTDQAESVMRDINTVLEDIYGLVSQAVNGTNGESDRLNYATNISEMTDHIYQLANSAVGGQYIFGGENTLTPPFRRAGTAVSYNSINDLAAIDPSDANVIDESDQHMRYNVGFSLDMDISINGIELAGAGEGNLFAQLDHVVSVLKNGDSTAEELTAQVDVPLDLQSKMLVNIVKMGVKDTKLETLSNRYAIDIINSTEIKSQVEYVSSGEAIMNMKMAESIYKQALAAGARIIMPTLMDFLN